jgi:hypothetical protein
MVKNKAHFEVSYVHEDKDVRNEFNGHFLVDNNCPIPFIKEMIFQVQKEIGQIEDQIKANMEAQAAQKKADEEASLPTTDEVKEDKVESING